MRDRRSLKYGGNATPHVGKRSAAQQQGFNTQNTLLKIFKGSDFQRHIFGNILGKILPDCSPV